MTTKAHRWIARLAMPIALALAGCPAPDHGDDDDNGDDDSAMTDDDDTTMGDDDDTTTGDDDDMTDYGPRTDDGTAPYHPDF